MNNSRTELHRTADTDQGAERSQSGAMKRPILIALAVLALLVAGGATVLLLNRDAGTLTISGKLELVDQNLATFSDDTCAGSGGYSDLRGGAQVVVTSASGGTIGLGQLGEGQWTTGSKLCTFPFSVEAPAGQGFYGVEVTHRGSVKYSEADLAQPLALEIR